MSEETFLLALTIFCGTIFAVSSMAFLNRLLDRRHERTLAAPRRTEDPDRLDRIERSVDATALEVERVSEATRYLVKLLSDRSAPRLPSRSERVITPH